MNEKLYELVNACGEDVDFSFDGNDRYCLIINDVEGFEDREYLNEKEIGDLIDWLDKNSITSEVNYGTTFIFKNFSVYMTYASYDI